MGRHSRGSFARFTGFPMDRFEVLVLEVSLVIGRASAIFSIWSFTGLYLRGHTF
jgi:hypothetical protein